MKPRDELLTLKDAIQLSRGDIRELYKHYANSGLATMMSLINFDKRFV
ncbi:MAG: putrescine aminotransferase, partial [Syntrophomonadaceae bacterium]|nr:putrescine aminotransferase [Syntrophomonadaceae bacterium]